MILLIEEAAHAMEKLSAFGGKRISDLIREDTNFSDDFLVRSVYHSAAIENNSFSIDETQVLLLEGRIPKLNRGVHLREVYELTNLKKAWDLCLDRCTEELTITFMHDVHALLMSNIDEESGRFKRTSNMVGGNLATPPEKVSVEILHLLDQLYRGWLLYGKSAEDTVRAAVLFHMEVERIHPYADGNGRLGRLLMNCILMKADIPPYVIAVEDRARYFSWLRTGDSDSFASYALTAIEKERKLLFRNRSGTH